MNFNIITLGCKVNQYESQAMREDMLKNGFLLSDDRDRADITIVNSCTVTSVSDAKNRKILNRVRRENPDGIVILTGCMPQAFPEESENFSNCDIVLGNAKRAELVPSIYKFLEEKQKFVHITEHIGKGEKYENLSVSSLGEHTRAFIKIEDGCNRFCSYCIIPYARGRVRSKSLEDLKGELIQVAANGYREVVLVGINLSAYGLDEDFDLADAVECACSVDGIDRVRLGSIEPERMDKEMIARLAAQPKFCPQFHLSLQSGCDATLRRMNRHGDANMIRDAVRRLREAVPDIVIRTTAIVGFPGETEEDFEATIGLIERVRYDALFTFIFSPREGTPAAKMDDPTPKADKNRRFDRLLAVQNRISEEKHRAYIGTTVHVLVDGRDGDVLTARTDGGRLVRFAGDDALLGQFADVEITGCTTWSLTGDLR